MRNISFLFTLLACLFYSSLASASDRIFFNGIQGKWSGPGEIVAGKFKGTKFVCTFGGTNPNAKTGMDVDGSCRVGVFSQPMNAKILKTAGRLCRKLSGRRIRRRNGCGRRSLYKFAFGRQHQA